MENRNAQSFTVIGVDIVQFSRLDSQAQQEVRAALREVLDEADDAAHMECDRWKRQDAEDGEFVLVPEDIPKLRLVTGLTQSLSAALEHRNADRTHEDRLRLRAVIHYGTGKPDPAGFSGSAVVTATRLLHAPQLRQALDDAPDADLAVLITDSVYQDVVQAATDLDLDALERLQIPSSGGAVEDCWMFVARKATAEQPTYPVADDTFRSVIQNFSGSVAADRGTFGIVGEPSHGDRLIVGPLSSERLDHLRATYVPTPDFESLRAGLARYRVQMLRAPERTGRWTTAAVALADVAETVLALDPEIDLRGLERRDFKRGCGYLLEVTAAPTPIRMSFALLSRLSRDLSRSDAYLVLVVDDRAQLDSNASEYLVRHEQPGLVAVLQRRLQFLLPEDAHDQIDNMINYEVVREELREAAGPADAAELADRLAREQAAPRRGWREQQVPQPVTDEDHQPEPRIARDYWTADDCLGYDQYAEAIASFIRHADTRPPLTIGIKAPWGAGKTSLMRMVQEQLDPPADREAWTPTRLRLTRDHNGTHNDRVTPITEAGHKRRHNRRRGGRASEVTNADPAVPVTIRELLHRASHPPRSDDQGVEDLDVDPPHTHKLREPSTEWRPTVWFNPWMYQSGEQVWAGLAHEIISQLSGRLEPGDRERFWLELNLRRVDAGAIRRQVYRALIERLLPLVVQFAVALVVVAAALLFAWLVPASARMLRPASAVVLSLGTLQAVLRAPIRLAKFLAEDAATRFRPLVGKPDLTDSVHRLATGELQNAPNNIVRDPGYHTRLGFLHLVHTDMKLVLDLVATERRPLVVFVDDLDRCSPSTVAQVIEAVNLFLAGQFPNCIFVLAIEPAMVAAHVEVAYKDLVATLGRDRLPGDWTTLGWRFLEKIVQLPLSLPQPAEPGRADSYLASLLADPEGTVINGTVRSDKSRPTGVADHVVGEEEPMTFDAAAGPSEVDQAAPSVIVEPDTDAARLALVKRVEAAIRARRPTSGTLASSAQGAQVEVFGTPGHPLRPETRQAANRVFTELYSDQGAQPVISKTLPALGSSNPREIKRFVNLFRFYTFIAQQDRLNGRWGIEVPSGAAIAKLAVLAIRWPHLLNALGGKAPNNSQHGLLSQLEQCVLPQPDYPVARDNDRNPVDAWNATLARARLIAEGDAIPSDLAWSGNLCKFLASPPSIAAAAERLL